MKRIMKAFLALTLVLTLVPSSTFSVLAREQRSPSISYFEEEDVQTPPPSETTETNNPTQDEIKNEIVDEAIKTSLNISHVFIDGESQTTEEVVISDLTVGDNIQTRMYAQEKEGYTLFSVDKEEIVLQEADNIVIFTYKAIKTEEIIPTGEPVITPVNQVVTNSSPRTINPDAGKVYYEKTANWVASQEEKEAEIHFKVFGNAYQKPVQVLLVLDVSASMKDGRVEPLKKAVAEFVEGLLTQDSSVSIGVITFNGTGETPVGSDTPVIITDNFYGYNQQINGIDAKKYFQSNMWDSIEFEGYTNYVTALQSAKKYFDDRISTIDTDKYVIFMSDGVPTGNNGINEANELKKINGLKVYSIGLDIELDYLFDNNLKPIATSGDYAINTKKEQLSSAYTKIANEIQIAGTNAVIEDLINTKVFEIVKDSGGTPKITTSIGSARYEDSTGKVIWDLGNIIEQEQTMTISVKVKSNLSPAPSGLVDTNDKAILAYKDVDNNEQTKEFEKPKLPFGSYGSIAIHNYLVDDKGNLIDFDNVATTDFNRRTDLSLEYIKEGESINLPVNKEYTIAPTPKIEINGKNYEYVSNHPNASTTGNYIIGSPSKQYVLYYAYKEVKEAPKFAYTVEYYLKNDLGVYELDATDPEVIVSVDPVRDILADTYKDKDAYKDIYVYNATAQESVTSINTGGTATVLKLYYDRVMEDLTYTVRHQIDSTTFEDVVIKNGTIWKGETTKNVKVTEASLGTNADDKFKGYKIDTILDKDNKPVTKDSWIPNGSVVTINYVKDETKTKTISYVVKHMIDTVVKDTDNETLTIWINDEKGTVKSIVTKSYPGYSVDQTTIDNAPKTIADKGIIEIKYTKDDSKTTKYQYNVIHKIESDETTKEKVEESIWAGETNPKLTVTSESLTAKTTDKFSGYEIESIKDKNNKQIVANDKVDPDMDIIITYKKTMEEINYSVSHKYGENAPINEVTYKGEIWVNDTDKTIKVAGTSIVKNDQEHYKFKGFYYKDSNGTLIEVTADQKVPSGTEVMGIYEDILYAYTINYISIEENKNLDKKEGNKLYPIR